VTEGATRTAGAAPSSVPTRQEPGPQDEGRPRASPMSFAQARLWILDRFSPGDPAYNIPAVNQFQGWINAPVLERSLNEIVRRHEALRTTFKVIAGKPSQVVAPSLKIKLEILDLRPLRNGPEKEARLGEVVFDESRRPFDLANGPLLRAMLVRLDQVRSVLVMVMHHIVSDGWSSTVLYRELAILYTAFLSGRPSPLPELPIQYADYAHWQSTWLSGQRLEEQLAYWRRQLSGLRPVLDLPTDRPRPPVQSHRGAVRGFRLDGAVLQELKALSQAQSATLFMTLLAAFKTLLHRLSGETDVAVGIPIANRTRAELEGLIGFFVNTLVLRSDLSGDPTFAEVVRREREVALSAYARQDVPFEKLVEEFQPERNLAHNPLFQIMFAVQNIGVVDPNAVQGEAPPISALGNGTAKFDLTLSLQDTGSGADGFLEYNTDLFDPPTIELMIARYAALLGAVGSRAEERISRLPIRCDADGEEDAAGWAGPLAAATANETILAALSRHAEATPDAAAILDGETEIGYAELLARAAGFARGLRAAGVAPGELVGIAMSPGGDAVVAILGTLAAGCRFLPLDVARGGGRGEGQEDRLDPRAGRILESLGASLAVVGAGIAAGEGGGTGVLRSFADLADQAESGAAGKLVDAAPDDIAGVVCRTTAEGGFCGVPLTHRALARATAHPSLRLQPSDRVALASPLTSDGCRFEIFGALAAGAALVPLPDARTAAPRRFASALRELAVSVLFAPPAAVERLARDFPWALRKVRLLLDDSRLTDWGSLSGSLAPEVVERMVSLFGDAGAGGYYALQSLAGLAGDAAAIPVGEPASGVTLHVLEADLGAAPLGVPGDLYVESAALAPAGGDDGEGPVSLPHVAGSVGHPTGDVVRRLAGPSLEYRRRRDGRLRVAGREVEAAEIELALRAHPAVLDAAVGLRPRSGLAEPLLAALFVSGEDGVEADELSGFLADRLPAHMVPSTFAAVEAIPGRRGAAVDRRALEDALAALDDARVKAEPYVEPRNDLETTLAQMWMDTLGTDRIGIKDNFFRLGGHSLLATQVVARISDAFRIDFPLQQLFEAPTIEQLAELIEPLAGSDHPPQARGILRVSRDRPIPLSFAQQRLWFLDQFEPDSAFYNIALPVRLPGFIAPATLEAAFNDLIERHETLRTTFQVVDGEPRQVIAPSYRLTMPVHDLRPLGAAERQREMERLTQEEAQKPFDLESGPVLRAELVRLGDDDNLLLATIHHIAADGWSTDVFFRELTTFYEARRTGRTASLPELAIQYADFACWQRSWLSGARLERQLDYWRNQLSGAPALLELPTDRPRPAVQTFTGGMFTTSLPAPLLHAVKELSSQQETTLFTALLAAFKTLLYRYTGAGDVVVGSPIANRTRPELEPLIGFFANTLVLRTRVAGSLSFRDLLSRVHEVALEGYAHQDIPFERLVEELHPERSLAYNPLFQVMFALQNMGRPAAAAAPSADLASPVIGAGVAKFDLTIFVTETSSRLDIGIEYNSDLFDPPTISRLADRYETLLRAAVADPDAPIGVLPMLTPAESLTLAEWNQTAAPVEAVCVHRLFEQQAARSPEAEALRLGGETLTYRQLDERANAWARRLIELGVEVDDRVAICMDRSLAMVTAVLATLKTGAAYLPLDPNYPADRFAFMLTDSRAKVVLSQRRLEERLPATEGGLVTVFAEDLPASGEASPVSAVGPDNLAYLIYTSGSTGRPKGVAMPHAVLANLVAWQIRRSALPPGARTLQFASLSFDVSFQEVFSTLCAGGVLVLLDEQRRRDPAALLRMLDDERVDRLFLPYVALQQLAEQGKHLESPPRSLSEVVTAGEQLHVTPEIRAFLRRLGATLYNQYGPSESHVVTELELAVPADAWPAIPPIGRPIPNATIHVLDERGQTCAIGIPGELHIGGLSVARGYARRPALTAERFVADPEGGAGGRLYATGDRARYLEDGSIQFLGRLDDQVKVRGFRVEPGEVEAVLRGHPRVQEAVVVPRLRDDGQYQLEAYVKPDPESSPTTRELREMLASRLPDYMVPTAFALVTQLPLTPSGKLDRRALPAATPPMARRDAPAALPQTPVQETLAAIWRDVLQLPQVGLHDDFFDLGGHSLLATRVISRIRDELGVELPVREMFERTTLEGLALTVVEAALELQTDDEVMQLLAELEAMPDDEVRTLSREEEP